MAGGDLHQLLAPWHVPLFLPIGPDEGLKAPEIKNVRALFEELHKVDERGRAFRYPVLTSGERSLEGFPDVLDLEAFQVAMLSVFNFLETVDSRMKQTHSDTLQHEQP